MKMLHRLRLPSTNLDVSVLCLGTAAFGTDIKDEQADRLVADYAAAGGNFFDTAHCYAFWKNGVGANGVGANGVGANGVGASERELGETLRRVGILHEAIIATKGGHPDNGPGYPRPSDFLSEAVIASDIDDSLNRLGMGCIPLYYLHRDDGKTPAGQIIQILNGEIKRGRIRYIGASNWSVKRIAEANDYAAQQGLHGFVASQIQGSLAQPQPIVEPVADPTTRFMSDADMAWHAASGVPLVLYSATAGGFFAGRGHDTKSGYAKSEENMARFGRAALLSARRGCTPTQAALAYLLHQAAPVVPLFSTGSRDHLAEVLGAADLVLQPEEVRWLRDG